MADLNINRLWARGKLNFIGISESGKNIFIVVEYKNNENYTDICELFSYLFNI